MRKIDVFVTTFAVVMLSACAPATTDYAADLKPGFDAFLETWNTGNYALLDDTVPDNFRRTAPGQSVSNRAELQAVMTALRTAYPDMKVVADNVHFARDRAFVHWTFTGTNTGPGDAPPTNKAVQIDGYTIMHFRGDMIEREEVYFDVLGWMTQLGATLTPPGG